MRRCPKCKRFHLPENKTDIKTLIQRDKYQGYVSMIISYIMLLIASFISSSKILEIYVFIVALLLIVIFILPWLNRIYEKSLYDRYLYMWEK